MDKDIVIKVENLSKIYRIYDFKGSLLKRKKYRNFYALRNVSFEVKRGESVGIIGHNGAGKSTLLKILTGVAFKSSGNVYIDGKISSLLELGSGFNPELTGIENIYFNGSLNGLTKKEIKNRLPEIISFADIGDFINQPVKNYSSGMFARLAFATAINVNPDILIVDEILSVGDIGFQVKCMGKFEEFRKMGKTIIYVSHNLSTVKKFCNRAIWLDHGEIVDDENSIIVVEKYFNLNFNYLYYENLKEIDSKEVSDIKVNALNNTISYDKGLSLYIEFRINKLTAYRIILELRKTDGKPNEMRYHDQLVCSFSTEDSNYKSFIMGINKIKLEIKRLNLMSGLYYLDFVIKDNDREIFRKINIYSFKIEDKYRGEGFIVFDHEWGVP